MNLKNIFFIKFFVYIKKIFLFVYFLLPKAEFRRFCKKTLFYSDFHNYLLTCITQKRNFQENKVVQYFIFLNQFFKADDFNYKLRSSFVIFMYKLKKEIHNCIQLNKRLFFLRYIKIIRCSVLYASVCHDIDI